MATLGYDKIALEDLARLALFLAQAEPSAVVPMIDMIRDALRVLEAHRLMGRPAEGGLHELVISHGATGYVALYGYSPLSDHVQVYGIRHQREAGFADD